MHSIAAFVRGLLFRVGASASKGVGDQIVFGLHQKTRLAGGAPLHGWPDASYLVRLQSEAAALGLFSLELDSECTGKGEGSA